VWSSYTLLFDNTAFDENQLGYSAIGIGVKNTDTSWINSKFTESGPSTAQSNYISSANDVSHHTGAWDL